MAYLTDFKLKDEKISHMDNEKIPLSACSKVCTRHHPPRRDNAQFHCSRPVEWPVNLNSFT